MTSLSRSWCARFAAKVLSTAVWAAGSTAAWTVMWTSTPSCTNADDAPQQDDSYFEPANIPHVREGEAKTLLLYAATLKRGAGGLELYAGIENRGPFPMCSAAFQVEFYGEGEALLATASTGVQSATSYMFSQSPYPVRCVAPGQKAMAVLDVPAEVNLENLVRMNHRFPAFELDEAQPVQGVRVAEVQAVESEGGFVLQGTVVNDADSPATDAVVSVFPVNAVGRPLGVAISSAATPIAPGGSWSFSTTPVAERGAELVGFAAASFTP